MKSYLIGVLVVGSLLALSGFILRSLQPAKEGTLMVPPTVVATPMPPDIHGCDATADYFWCEPKQKCLRPMDEKCEGVVATRSATRAATSAASSAATRSASRPASGSANRR